MILAKIRLTLSLLAIGMLTPYVFDSTQTIYPQVDNKTLFIKEPPIDQNFLWNGMISSEASRVPGKEDTQSAIILYPRADGGVYSGVLTYQASRPVNVSIWNWIELGNITEIPEGFGRINNMVKLEGTTMVLQDIEGGISGSIPFVGNAIELISREPFITTYGVNAMIVMPKNVTDLRSLTNSSASGPT